MNYLIQIKYQCSKHKSKTQKSVLLLFFSKLFQGLQNGYKFVIITIVNQGKGINNERSVAKNSDFF